MRPILARRPTERKTALLRLFCNRLIYTRLEKKAGFRNTKSDWKGCKQRPPTFLLAAFYLAFNHLLADRRPQKDTSPATSEPSKERPRNVWKTFQALLRHKTKVMKSYFKDFQRCFYTKKFNLNSWLQKQEKRRKRLLDHVFFHHFSTQQQSVWRETETGGFILASCPTLNNLHHSWE